MGICLDCLNANEILKNAYGKPRYFYSAKCMYCGNEKECVRLSGSTSSISKQGIPDIKYHSFRITSHAGKIVKASWNCRP